MNFVSEAFILFLVIVFALFVALPATWRRPLLLVASYVFYATWNVPFILVILLTTSLDYWISRIIQNSSSEVKRKTLLWTGIVINLLVLGFFKYFNFFLENAVGIAHWLGYAEATPPALAIILPLGISFYTFEAISYMVDVYRGKLPARNWWHYNFYIMYFPHLISGPIVRFCEFWPQCDLPLQLPERERYFKAAELILLGFAFKVLIADPMAGVADPFFADPSVFTVLESYIGVLTFTVQIYFDFMGYTHIARGVSLLFNIELPLNFNHPYIARNISDFWERWHISLSRWIRDYLFIPMGGSRGKRWRISFNLIVTMLICGAWHGAGWTYVLWGGYHGVLLAGSHWFRNVKSRLLPPGLLAWMDTPVFQPIAIGLTFFTVMLGWVLFRAADFATAQEIFAQLLNFPRLVHDVTHNIAKSRFTDIMTCLGLLTLCFGGRWAVDTLGNFYRPLPLWAKVSTSWAAILLCWIMAAESVVPFIYFQF